MMNLSMYARARPVAYWSQLLKFSLWSWFMFILKNNQSVRQTELHVRTDLKHIQVFFSPHPYFVRKSSVDSKERVQSCSCTWEYTLFEQESCICFWIELHKLTGKKSAQRINFEIVVSWALNHSFPKKIKPILCSCWGDKAITAAAGTWCEDRL